MCAITGVSSKWWLGVLAGLVGPFLPLAAENLAELLPKKPRPVAALETRETRAEDKEVWFQRTRFFKDASGKDVRHGVQTEHRRLKDQERFQSEYTVTHQCYYEGEPGPHRVVLTYASGHLASVEYRIGDKAAILREFDPLGQELPDAQGARGAKHKRQNVLLLFDDVYGRFPPAP